MLLIMEGERKKSLSYFPIKNSSGSCAETVRFMESCTLQPSGEVGDGEFGRGELVTIRRPFNL